eukprot:scaffold38108_cov155-Skeletonema_dohrnii-CCMP3373.AAC.2
MSKRSNLANKFTAEAKPSTTCPVSSTNSEALNKTSYQGDSETSLKKRKLSSKLAKMSLQSLIPPQGKLQASQASQESESKSCGSQSANEDKFDQSESKVDWDAVIERATSHPHEAKVCYSNQARLMIGLSTDSTEPRPTINYKPLHAACECDPPLKAIEALISAHPSAALDCTFEGTALKIAAESRISSIEVLRFLLVAELAMWKRLLQDTDGKEEDADIERKQTSSLYHGKNPIHWICEPHIPVKVAGTLLILFPEGAFKRQIPTELKAKSPLIEIIDDFARGQDDIDIEDEGNAVDDEYDEESFKSQSWQKFLYILYATDRAHNHIRPLPFTVASGGATTTPNHSLSYPASLTCATMNNETGQPQQSSTPPQEQRKSESYEQIFHPVHAITRCITNQKLGLELCQVYGVWSILDEMSKRMPQEEFDGSFQILAESQAADCRLCRTETKDIVEFLIDTDHKTAVASLEVAVKNGWPCKEVLPRKTAAKCA